MPRTYNISVIWRTFCLHLYDKLFSNFVFPLDVQYKTFVLKWNQLRTIDVDGILIQTDFTVHLLKGQSPWISLGLNALLKATTVIAHGLVFMVTKPATFWLHP